MINRPHLFLASAAVIALLPGAAFAAPKVVASVKPLHSMVAAVMEGVGEPSLIVEGAASPHTYSLKPSNARTLQDADVVFWVGHGLEAFLEKPLEALAGKAVVTEMEDAPGVETLSFREGGPFEAHGDDEHAEAEHDHEDHAEAGHDHEHGAFDMHLWLDPMNAKAMASEIEAVLTKVDPENAAIYRANAETLHAALDALDREVTEILAPVKDRPFVVFHDAYQYFEHRYGVNVAGSVTVSPEVLPGAERISEIHEKLKSLDAACVFAEPQFEPKLISVVTEGTNAKGGVLDPIGTELEDGPALYPQLIRNLATAMKTCLEG